jgi:hypothetical protein
VRNIWSPAPRGTTHRTVLDEAVGERRRVAVEVRQTLIDPLGDAAHGER